MSDFASRYERGLDVLSTLCGSEQGARALAGFFESQGALGSIALRTGAGEIWSRSELSRRDRSLVVISALTALSLAHELGIHLRGALRHGVTKLEIEEVMMTMVLYGGFPRAIDGMHLARGVFAERSSS